MKKDTLHLMLALGAMTILIVNCSETNKKSNNLNRVESAVEEKKEYLSRQLKKINIEWEELNLFIRGFKQEKKLEIWVKKKTQKKFQKFIEYDFCKLSGELGPKRKEGDRQVPEGFYKINRFNPKSKFYLSLGLNYPNKSDKIRGDKNKPGSDIFIHGACATVGCVPITDDKIKELYILAEQARENGQKSIFVNIYPAKLTVENLIKLEEDYERYIGFWKELQIVYDQFERTKEVPVFGVNDRGGYFLK